MKQERKVAAPGGGDERAELKGSTIWLTPSNLNFVRLH